MESFEWIRAIYGAAGLIIFHRLKFPLCVLSWFYTHITNPNIIKKAGIGDLFASVLLERFR